MILDRQQMLGWCQERHGDPGAGPSMLVKALEYISLQERLRELSLFRRKMWKLRGDLISVLSICRRCRSVPWGWTRLCWMVPSTRTGDKGQKKFHLHMRKNLACKWPHTGTLHREAVEFPSLDILKSCLNTVLNTMILFEQAVGPGDPLWSLPARPVERFCEPQREWKSTEPRRGWMKLWGSCQLSGLRSPVPQRWCHHAGRYQRNLAHSTPHSLLLPGCLEEVTVPILCRGTQQGQGFLPPPAEIHRPQQDQPGKQPASQALGSLSMKACFPLKLCRPDALWETKGYWKLLLARDECRKVSDASRLMVYRSGKKYSITNPL